MNRIDRRRRGRHRTPVIVTTAPSPAAPAASKPTTTAPTTDDAPEWAPTFLRRPVPRHLLDGEATP